MDFSHIERRNLQNYYELRNTSIQQASAFVIVGEWQTARLDVMQLIGNHLILLIKHFRLTTILMKGVKKDI